MRRVSINPCRILLGEKGWNKEDDEPILIVKVEPTHDYSDIMSISYEHNGRKGVTNSILSTSLVGEISDSLLTPDVSSGNKTYQGSSLAARLGLILQSMDEDEVYSVGSPYGILAGGKIIKSDHDPEQQAVDMFVAGISIYLTVMDLLDKDILWEIFPFPFDIPGCSPLTSNSMNYMKIPMSSTKLLGTPLSKELCWMMTTFINSWSVNFIQGGETDNRKLLHDTMNNVASLLINRSSGADRVPGLENRVKNLESKIEFLQASLNQLLEENQKLKAVRISKVPHHLTHLYQHPNGQAGR